MTDEIINKVANSGLITLDLEEYYPKGERYFFDMKEHFFEGLLIREKEFRNFVKSHNWMTYQNKFVAIGCTSDAIVPVWAYMLLSNALTPYASKIVYGNLKQLESILFEKVLEDIKLETFEDKRIIIKGCSNKPIPEHAYVRLTQKLSLVAKSIMFGEACSSVPIYKKK